MSEIRNIFMAGSIDLSKICSKLKIEHLNTEIQKYAKEGKNGHVYLSSVFSSKKEPSQWGQTHNLALSAKEERSVFIGDFRDFTKDDNNYQPQPQKQSYQQPTQQPQASSSRREEVDTDSLPF